MACLVLAFGVASLILSPAGAQTVTASGPSGSDFATEAFSDPWDFSNEEDLVLATEGPMQGAEQARLEDGSLRFTMRKPGYFSPLWGGWPGSLPHGREGAANPIDSRRFHRVVLRITASSTTPAGVIWFSCPRSPKSPASVTLASCQGGTPFEIRRGTHTYDIDLRQSPGYPDSRIAWSGPITGLRVALSPEYPTEFSFDWIRLVGSDEPADSAYAGPIPEILEPDRTGGSDLATALGDPWDMSNPEDVARTDHVTAQLRDGFLFGRNAGTKEQEIRDPSVTLHLRKQFSGSVFHRLTVGYTYDGPFSLGFGDNGGVHARLIWRLAGTPVTRNGADLQTSEDIVTYPNQSQFTVDLATPAPVDVVDDEQNGPRIGWSGQVIELVRFDPNEDRSPRTWKLDFVRLAADDAAAKTFTIRWLDRSGPGGLASLYADTDAQGFDGTPIVANLPVHAGENRYEWTPPTAGTWYVYLVIRRGGAVMQSYSTGPVQFGGKNVDPFPPCARVSNNDSPCRRPSSAPSRAAPRRPVTVKASPDQR